MNTAFWKEDLYKANSYNEEVTRLGHKKTTNLHVDLLIPEQKKES